MSSKVFRGDVQKLITPIVWRSGPAGHPSVHALNGKHERQHLNQSTLQPPNGTVDHEQRNKIYEQGLQEGQAAARKQHEEEVQPVVERLAEIMHLFADLRSRIRRETEKELVSLSLAVARRILHRELTLDPEVLRSLVKVALDRIATRELNRVRTHPAHIGFLQPVLERACSGKNVELVADPSLQLGDILFETPQGDLDASIDSQLEEIHHGLTDRLGT